MKGKEKKGRKRETKKNEPDETCGCKQGFLDEHEGRVRAAVKESVARFVANNRANIQRSTKEQVAIASYGGGMVDMVMLVRSALGRWAVEQMLMELENWNASKESCASPSVNINIKADGKGGISQEQVKELGEHIAEWLAKKNGNGKKRSSDPMFA